MSWNPKTVRADITKSASTPVKAPRGQADKAHLEDMRKLENNPLHIDEGFVKANDQQFTRPEKQN